MEGGEKKDVGRERRREENKKEKTRTSLAPV
jgi:hypothetical protein